MRIVALEPYLTGSHRHWLDGLTAHSAHEIIAITMPGQFWKWRMSGAAPTLAARFAELAATSGPVDLVLATSLVDVAAFTGLARRALGDTPVALYMHENQITYPEMGRTRRDPALALKSLASTVAADRVIFNSQFHLDEFHAGARRLLASFPDERPHELVDRVAAKSTVLPVGIDPPPTRGPRHERPLVLWNHRWDPDKDVGRFLTALFALSDLDFDVVLTGERFVDQPAEHADGVAAVESRLVVNDFLPLDEYRSWLGRCDIVVSTARQEFFGVSVVEAVAAGCFPVLPDALVYPEHVAPPHRERCLYRTDRQLVSQLRWAIEHRSEARSIGAELAAGMRRYEWPALAPRYDELLESITPS